MGVVPNAVGPVRLDVDQRRVEGHKNLLGEDEGGQRPCRGRCGPEEGSRTWWRKLPNTYREKKLFSRYIS